MGRAFDAGSTREPSDRRIARLAARQHGVFSRQQAIEVGATKDTVRRRLASGHWDALSADVFRFAGAPPSWRQSLTAACLAWGDDASASHFAAAPLWRVPGFDPGPIELTVPRGRRRRGPGVVHRNLLPAVDVTRVEGIPVTTATRTLIDLASVAEPALLEEALDDALRRRIVSIPRLRWRLEASAHRRGVVAMRALVEARVGATTPQSVFETRLLRAMRAAGIPEPVGQLEVRRGAHVIAVVDFAFPRERVAIEADGYRWHSGRARWDHDRSRSNALTLLGWRVIHVTWTDLDRHPQQIVASIREALVTEP